MARKTLLDILVSENALSGDEAADISEQAQGDPVRIENILAEAHVPSDSILTAKSTLYGVPPFRLQEKKIPFEILKNISEESARHYQIAPLDMANDTLLIGMVQPDDIEAREALKFISSNLHVPYKVFVISRSDFESIIAQYKGLGGEVERAIGEFEQEHEKKYPEQLAEDLSGMEMVVEDTPVTKLVAVILKHATEGRASDVHIEPGSKQLRVRFRLDGILYTSLLLPASVHDAVVARVKILAHMKLDEKRKPQDGRFGMVIASSAVDFRVSSFPTFFGEKIVIRILDPTVGIKTLPDLGLMGRNLNLIEKNIKRPYGMILVTGPTGSGKSTTLYAILQALNQERSNIVSLEDPIEYNVEGVNQSQVRPEINYTFATGLRSVLRQDPDIIMVGEIRDKETAQLAIHAALTGHLVLSTLHTNNAVGVIPRLIDMGVDPFLISPTLVLAIGQRLVRTLCPDSRKPVPVEGKVKELLVSETSVVAKATGNAIPMPDEVYSPLPSAACPKGTRGRVGIFEVLEMTPQLEKLILEEQPSEAKIEAEASRQGMLTMRQDAMLKALEGVIGIEELAQV
jgi:type IV pilus assembly protein PilB